MKSGDSMPTVVLHRDFSCAPEGHTVLYFKAGDEIDGRAAELAMADDAAFVPETENFNPVEETQIMPKLERKRGKK